MSLYKAWGQSLGLALIFWGNEHSGRWVVFIYLFIIHLFIYLAVWGLSCGTWDLVTWPGIKPSPPVLGMRSPSGRTVIRGREHKRTWVTDGGHRNGSRHMESKIPGGLDYRGRTVPVILEAVVKSLVLWACLWAGPLLLRHNAGLSGGLIISWPHSFSCSFLLSTWSLQWGSLRLHESHSIAPSEASKVIYHQDTGRGASKPDLRLGSEFFYSSLGIAFPNFNS